MNEDTENQQGTAPSEPDHDPMQHPAPPANPETDDEAVEKSEEQIEKVVGN